MEIYTVALFGHRRIDDLRELENKLAPIVKNLIQSRPFISYLIGRNGEFDEFAASVIKLVRKQINAQNTDLTLVLPYQSAKSEDYERYYDNIIIPDNVYGIHPKAAIGARNRWMVEHADLIIANVEHEYGGAHTAIKYARHLSKLIINLPNLTSKDYN